MGEVEDEQTECYNLHPRANGRDRQSRPEQSKLAILERSKGAKAGAGISLGDRRLSRRLRACMHTVCPDNIAAGSNWLLRRVHLWNGKPRKLRRSALAAKSTLTATANSNPQSRERKVRVF